MRWRRGSDTSDVIDQRAAGSSARGGRLPLPGGVKLGGGAGVVGLVVFLLITLIGGGGDSGFAVNDQFDDPVQAPGQREIPAAQDPEKDLKEFSAYVFNSTQQTWEDSFRQQGEPYERAKLVLYRGGVSTGCGSASSAVGPFYCPADRRVYLDFSFYRDMAEQLGAQGDFARAYVIAHEMGHHVQQQLGTSDEVRRLEGEQPSNRNELSVRQELQADCYAGVWSTARAISSPATSARPSTRRKPSATIVSSGVPPAASIPTASRTGPPSSAHGGSRSARRTASLATAIPSAPAISSLAGERGDGQGMGDRTSGESTHAPTLPK